MIKNESKAPKVFISYSWSSPAHKNWVLTLAQNLMENGVNVALDQWDMNPGNRIYPYMESMLSDKTIDKVIMVCDALYAQKADSREKGVGTEAQIISAEIYKKAQQDKFIPVLSEVNDKGEPYLPVYCRGLVFIDMSDEDQYGDGLMELLRAIHSEPLLQKPEIGEKPNFSSSAIPSISTSSLANAACASIRAGGNSAIGDLGEYFSAFAEQMDRFSIDDNTAGFELTMKNVEDFLPYRNEIVKVFLYIARYSREQDAINEIHKFFESVLPYYDIHRGGVSHARNIKADNFKFLVHEMFLYTVAALVKYEKFEHVAYIIDTPYYAHGVVSGTPMLSFWHIWRGTECWDMRNNSLKLGRASLRADSVMDRVNIQGLTGSDIMQADLILAIKGKFSDNHYANWYPDTLGHAYRHGIFKIFAKAQSRKYFDKIKVMWGVDTPHDLIPAIESIARMTGRGNWGFEFIYRLIDPENLCKLP